MQIANVPPRKSEPIECSELVSDEAARSAPQNAELFTLHCSLAGTNRRPKVGKGSAVALEVRGELRICDPGKVPRKCIPGVEGRCSQKERTASSVGRGPGSPRRSGGATGPSWRRMWVASAISVAQRSESPNGETFATTWQGSTSMTARPTVEIGWAVAARRPTRRATDSAASVASMGCSCRPTD